MLNHINIMGRIVADPALKTTSGGTHVTTFRIACDRDVGRDDAKATDFIDIVAWRTTADFVCKYFSKGMPILVDGRLQMREYTNKDGNKVRVAEILANNVYFCGGDRKPADAAPAPADFTNLDADDPDCPWNADAGDDLPL